MYNVCVCGGGTKPGTRLSVRCMYNKSLLVCVWGGGGGGGGGLKHVCRCMYNKSSLVGNHLKKAHHLTCIN